MPAQDRVRGDDQTQSSTACFGCQTEQQRDDRAIGPVRARTSSTRSKLALQDGQLVAKQQYLDGLVIVAASPPQSKRGNEPQATLKVVGQALTSTRRNSSPQKGCRCTELFLVSMLSRRWGVYPAREANTMGRVVWAEVAAV